MKMQRRQNDANGQLNLGDNGTTDYSSTASKASMIAAIAILGAVFAASTLIYCILRCRRQKNKQPPKWLPSFIRRRWATPGQGTYARASSRADGESNSSQQTNVRNNNSNNNNGSNNNINNNTNINNNINNYNNDGEITPGVGRVQSVRSIMTLPEYRSVPKPEFEQTIAKEGERDGIDIIVEFPETTEEEENRRENHMQMLYEVRQARAAEREERRLRREARARGERPPARTAHLNYPPMVQSLLTAGATGDSTSGVGNNEDGTRNRSTSGSSIASMSRAELIAIIQGPPKKLPQVAYADIGMAKPDGSRVKPVTPSSESETTSLPDSYGNGEQQSSAAPSVHSRNFSSGSGSSSLFSVNSSATAATTTSLLHPYNIQLQQQGTRSRTSSLSTVDSVHVFPSSPSIINGSRDSLDLGMQRRDTLPPLYDNLEFEDAPPYESPVRTRFEVDRYVPEVRVTDTSGNRVSLRSPLREELR